MGRYLLAVTVLCLLISISCTENHASPLYVDSAVEAEIRQIKAIDNHAHPERVTGYGESDNDSDALPIEDLQDSQMPPPFRSGSSYFPEAWHALFGYDYNDTKPEHLRQLEQAKSDVAKKRGDQYPSWVLNQANTDIMLANRVAMGRGLPGDRFKWVPFFDMFLLPLNNDVMKARDPDHKAFAAREEALLKRLLASEDSGALPGNLDDYLTFITHVLETWKAGGAVALKSEFAYLRDLDFSNPQKENADRVYSIYVRGSEPTPEEYKIVQDFLFRYISREAGRMGMPIHIHCALGVNGYFREANANPIALESVFNDAALRKTKFVMLHGGWPFAREAAALILKPNVYVDFSALSYLTYPMEASKAIRLYLESSPEKVLYASDASPFKGDVGWEETAWLGSTKGRLALGIALTGMIEDGEITRDRAKDIAHLVMRENARQLYGF